MIEARFNILSYNFDIPKNLIAQEPLRPRDSSRLLILEGKKKAITDKAFRDILDFLTPGDVLVLNNTEVIKARLVGKTKSGAKLELLLLKQVASNIWEVLVKPGKRAKIGQRVIFDQDSIEAEIIGKTAQGGRRIKFNCLEFEKFLETAGEVPLPSYIKKKVSKPGDYQTVYARSKGAVAAPTAGLHFTEKLLKRIRQKGVKIVNVTLHCSLATFRPVKTEDIRNHRIESEWIEVSKKAAKTINAAKSSGKKIFAVGTTAVRTLESVSRLEKGGKFKVRPFCGDTNLYIVPGYKFKIVDAVITNFHTPCSTNLILIASFCGLEPTRKSYFYAKKSKFRFFSFGDAMLIV